MGIKVSTPSEVGEPPQQNISFLLSVNSSLVNKRPKGKGAHRVKRTRTGPVPSTNKECQEDSYTMSKVAQGAQGLRRVGSSPGERQRRAREGRVCSVGHRSLNRTAKELMHHSKENQGPLSCAPATSHTVDAPLQAGRCAHQSGLGWRGHQRPISQQPLHLFFPAL